MSPTHGASSVQCHVGIDSSDRQGHAIRRVRDELRVDILSGQFDGGMLPGEQQLIADFNTSRAVIRGALGLLRDEGIVERVRGTGTLAIVERHRARLTDFHHGGDRGQTLAGMSGRVVTRTVVRTPLTIARQFGKDDQADCLLFEYIGYLFGQALGIYTNYMRLPDAEALLSGSFDDGWSHMIRRAGLSITQTQWEFEVLSADSSVTEFLDMEVGQPLIGLKHVMVGREGRPIGVSFARIRGDRVSLSSLSRTAGSRTRAGRAPTLK